MLTLPTRQATARFRSDSSSSRRPSFARLRPPTRPRPCPCSIAAPAASCATAKRSWCEIRTSDDPRPIVGAVSDAGAEVTHVSDTYRTITASVDERDLRAVAAVTGVDHVQEVITPMTGEIDGADGRGRLARSTPAPPGSSPRATLQLQAGTARTQFDVDGSGVKVGVLSDSYDTKPTAGTRAADDVASNDLPGASELLRSHTTRAGASGLHLFA